MATTRAAKVEDYRLVDYELVFIISPEVEDAALDATIDNVVNKFIMESGGTISNVERWGKRRLAYPIKNFMEGVYVLAHFRFKSGLCKEFEANLRISEEVLRHLLVKLGT